MNRILIFNDTTTIGGAEILLINIFKHLSTRKCELTLLLPYSTDDTTLINSIPPSVKVRYIYKKAPKGIKQLMYKNLMVFFPRLYLSVIGFKADAYDRLVCFKDSFYSIAFAQVQLPKFVWIHTQPYDRDYKSHSLKEYFAVALNRLHMKRMYKCFRLYDQVFCVSDTCKSEFLRITENGQDRESVKVIYNALSLGEIATKADENLGIPLSDLPTFVVVHRFSPEKRIDRMVHVSKRLLAEGYQFRIFILGKGDEFENIKLLVEENKLSETIFLLGHLDNPYPYIKQSDWLVCCSSRDSFSLVLLEAISLGTPIITTNCGGPVDVIEQGKYGILTANSTEGVYEAMKKVLDDPSLKEYYVSKSEECLKRFDYQEWLSKIDEILEV